jgi:acyl-CoA dehydrogenase
MIIFGQGAIRCHPYAYQELSALADGDATKFDKAFWGHIGHVVRNACRSLVLSLTRGWFAGNPGGPLACYYRKLSWCSASFAILADVAMGAFGGTLKFREKITGRFADILSGMYLATTILRRYEAEGRRPEDRAFAEYALAKTFVEIQTAFDGLYGNMNIPVLGAVLKYIVGFWSRVNAFSRGPSDVHSHKIARALMTPGSVRDGITSRALFMPKKGEPFADLEEAFQLSCRATDVYGKIRSAVKTGKLAKGKPEKLLSEAAAAGVVSREEVQAVEESIAKRRTVIQVDAFDVDAFAKGGHHPV